MQIAKWRKAAIEQLPELFRTDGPVSLGAVRRTAMCFIRRSADRRWSWTGWVLLGMLD